MVKIKVNVKTKNDSIPSDTTKRKMPIVVDPKLHPHPRYHDTNVGDIRLGMDGYAYLFTPISFSITLYVKITLIAAILLLLLAISLHFCWKYLLGVLYIFAVLIQREYLDTIFTSNSAFLTICYTNIAVILVILFLGIQQFFRNIKSGQH